MSVLPFAAMSLVLRSWPVSVLLAIASCTCTTEPPPAAKVVGKAAEKAPAKAEPKAEPAGGPVFDASAPPTTATAPSAPEAKAEAKAEGDDPLGRRFTDPPWFRKDMLEGAKAMDVSRSERNAEGLFSSQILFELPAGTTAESCAEQLETKVGAEVKNLARNADEKQPGRIKITGDTERYRVTLMCGEAKGVMRAYVSFEWLS